jgi:hypothetical protein
MKWIYLKRLAGASLSYFSNISDVRISFFFETYTAREAPAVVGSIISIKRSYCTNCSPGGQERREKLSVQINERTKGGLFHNWPNIFLLSLFWHLARWLVLVTLHRLVTPKSLSWWGKVDISLIVQHSPSRVAPVGCNHGIGVDCNLFW